MRVFTTIFGMAQPQLASPVVRLDAESAGARYWDQDEFLVVEQFLDASSLTPLIAEANAMRSEINRNYVPTIKKGGSVSYFDLVRSAPSLVGLYRSPAFIELLSGITREQLLVCPDDDPHACALYYYTEPGDHIAFHYDTSFYRGKRFTVLLGLVEQSSCRLVCELFKRNPAHETQTLSVQTLPGTLVMFNGDKLHHAVTPSGPGEDRVVLSMEYVTDQSMGAVPRMVSKVKDAVAYFGLKSLRRGR
jgi:hypothetical protein